MDLDNVQHLLPESVVQMVDLIGLRRTLDLVDRLGGITFPFALAKTRRGMLRFEMIAEIVGVDAANEITRVYGGERLSIPKCAAALREQLHRELRGEFDRLTAAGHSAIASVATLARQYRYTDRHVWRILKEADIEPEPPRQHALF